MPRISHATVHGEGNLDWYTPPEGDPEGKVITDAKAVDPDAGPTIKEWVEAGYLASNYPPKGFNSKSTPEEIDDAIKAETAKIDAAAGGDGEPEPAKLP